MTKFDATTMHERPAVAAETRLIDDGSGTVRVWRVFRTELVEIPPERHGIFFAGDCYIVWYNYRTNTQKYIVYFWLVSTDFRSTKITKTNDVQIAQGLHASQDETGVAALKTIEKDDECGGVAVQVRVVQGREPAHFLQLFKGKMITFRGKGTDFDSKCFQFRKHAPNNNHKKNRYSCEHQRDNPLRLFGTNPRQLDVQQQSDRS